ncbi:MAG: hypothetical protein L0Y72_27010 [Gemmataceae bacterium]|nr:hypothetical protein [Gemmataceae bacterium]MCI0742701.1 hypothetical protein [Gemmataceae bacterium]
MNKLGTLILWALAEIYHGKTQSVPAKGGIPGILRIPSVEELKKYFKTAGAGDYDKKVHWCGIFQTYLLIKAGVACHWKYEIVDDSNGKDLEILKGPAAQKGLAIGDIVRIHHHEHHFMVFDPVASGFVRSFEGNAQGPEYPTLAANWMGNMKHNVVSDIYMRYRVLS